MKKALIYIIATIIILGGLVTTIKPVRAFVLEQVPEGLIKLLEKEILHKLQTGEIAPPENPPGFENAEGGISEIAENEIFVQPIDDSNLN